MAGLRQPKFSVTNMNIYKLISTDLVPFPYVCVKNNVVLLMSRLQPHET